MSKKLNETQLIAATLLATGAKAKDVAGKLGIREETVSRWRNQEGFYEILSKASNDILDEIIDQQKLILSLSQDALLSVLRKDDFDPYKKALVAIKCMQLTKESDNFYSGIIKNFYKSNGL